MAAKEKDGKVVSIKILATKNYDC